MLPHLLFLTLIQSQPAEMPKCEPRIYQYEKVTKVEARQALTELYEILKRDLKENCKLTDFNLDKEEPGHLSSFSTTLRFTVKAAIDGGTEINSRVYLDDTEQAFSTSTVFLFDENKDLCGLRQTESYWNIFGDQTWIDIRIHRKERKVQSFQLLRSQRNQRGDQFSFRCDSSD